MDHKEKTATESKENRNLDGVVVPPGQWKLGVLSDKAKAIILRFATKCKKFDFKLRVLEMFDYFLQTLHIPPDDKKVKGAEKMSEYYKKHGNPNFEGAG